jgi:hypothetical protein
MAGIARAARQLAIDLWRLRTRPAHQSLPRPHLSRGEAENQHLRGAIYEEKGTRNDDNLTLISKRFGTRGAPVV